ncbi:MAG: hypothetical protein COB30_009165 [Ectothiorhodospiraceae bacterium]|nr:hypothetical protein [Ectothiorhodospiraceae bacterium]
MATVKKSIKKALSSSKKSSSKKSAVKTKATIKAKAATTSKVSAKKTPVKKKTVKKATVKVTSKATSKTAAKSRGLGLTYITRMDHGNTHGWWVRVYKDSKPVESKLFSDGVHGSKPKAKLRAQEHRDKVVKKNKIVPVHLRKTGEHSVDRRSTSGMVGVTLSVTNKAGSLRVHWSARFMEKGRQRNVSFSVRKYGYEGAYRKALRVRCDAIGSNPPRGLKPPLPNRELKKWMKTEAI